MNLSCDVIRDLLPLYAEGLESEGSKRIVETHLPGCPDCRKELELLRKPAHIPAESTGMASVRREIGRRRGLTVACAVLLLCSVLCWAANWLTSPIYLDESVITGVTDNLDGTVTIEMDAAAAGVQTFQVEIEPGPSGETLVVWTNRWMEHTWSEPIPRPFAITRTVLHDGVFLFTGREGEADLLIYENPRTFLDGGKMTLPRLFLNVYFRFALATGLLLLATAWLLRRKKFAMVPALFGSLSLCYALCQGLISEFSFVSFYATREFLWGAVMTLFTWTGGLCLWKLKKHK